MRKIVSLAFMAGLAAFVSLAPHDAQAAGKPKAPAFDAPFKEFQDIGAWFRARMIAFEKDLNEFFGVKTTALKASVRQRGRKSGKRRSA